ncbi:Thymus-specific serine protease [Perkinsus chesapeaki]|uniref:Thymus-specific serine protease n=1 Tax=Perkinsus chesapeaki TaxID=330153 RepID=A0A7J6MWD6_PERCH|nr:Thymus-specific serine protease [Perkinsus chesapeaki]
MEQIVADVAAFGKDLQAKVPGVKIVLFGCSTAGLIAALARQKHRDIFIGAVTSSTAFKFKLANDVYYPVLSQDLSNPSLGGSPQCLATLTNAHMDFANSMGTAGGRREVEKKLKICDGLLEDVNDQIYTTTEGNLLGTNLQYNDPTCIKDYCNIRKICDRLTKGSDAALDKLADIYNTNQPTEPGSCRKRTARGLIDLLKNRMVESPRRLSAFYICNTRGLLAECSRGSCPFYTNKSWIDFWLMVCEEGFGLSRDEMLKNIGGFQQYVEESLNKATNILSINGDADPWYPSSITKARAGLEVMWVKGASHCYWCAHSDKDVVAGILEVVNKWLA